MRVNKKFHTRTAVGFGAFLLASGGMTGMALAYPPGTAMTVTSSGNVVTVANAQPGCTVTVTVNGKSVGSGVADSDGTLTINTTVPSGATLGATQEAGDGCDAETASGEAPHGGGGGGGGNNPSRTGSDTTLGIVAGLGALGVGGGLVVASRRRKS